jgi:hypothetical protein
MDVIGIDLAGPCNAADTAVAAFRANGRGLVLQERLVGADDAAIAALIGRTRPTPIWSSASMPPSPTTTAAVIVLPIVSSARGPWLRG